MLFISKPPFYAVARIEPPPQDYWSESPLLPRDRPDKSFGTQQGTEIFYEGGVAQRGLRSQSIILSLSVFF
jgi:hypothetical protein